jgi:hypothetical protein
LKCPRIDAYCALYKLDGTCAYPGGKCKPVVEECVDCKHIVDNICRIYPNPAAKWQKERACPRRHNITEFERRRHVKDLQAKKYSKAKTQVANLQQKETRSEDKKSPKTKKMGRFRKLIKKLLKI